MILSDFLSRQKIDSSKPHEIIPISFNMRNILQDRYYKNRSVKCAEDKYLVQTRSQSKLSSIKLPEVHRVKKGIDQNVQPEKQTLEPTKESPEASTSIKKPRLGQGRAGPRRKLKETSLQPSNLAEVVPPLEKQKSES